MLRSRYGYNANSGKLIPGKPRPLYQRPHHPRLQFTMLPAGPPAALLALSSRSAPVVGIKGASLPSGYPLVSLAVGFSSLGRTGQQTILTDELRARFACVPQRRDCLQNCMLLTKIKL